MFYLIYTPVAQASDGREPRDASAGGTRHWFQLHIHKRRRMPKPPRAFQAVQAKKLLIFLEDFNSPIITIVEGVGMIQMVEITENHTFFYKLKNY